MKITANNVSLNYEVDGPEGAPWMTFSNSLAADLTMWDPQVNHFKDNYRILRYDTRGHGKSEPASSFYPGGNHNWYAGEQGLGGSGAEPGAGHVEGPCPAGKCHR